MNKLYSLSTLLLALLVVPLAGHAHCKGKHTGNHPHCSGGEDPPNTHLGNDYTATDGVDFISPSDVGSFDYHIIGTPAQDDIYGGGGADLIEGNDGDDEIFARGGDDEIHGGGGRDSIHAGTGDDIIYAGDGGAGISPDEGNDFAFGGVQNDSFNGGEGTDWLEGGDGDDWFEFSLGKLITLPDQYEVDHYDGGTGQDGLGFTGRDDFEIVESVTVDLSLGIYQAMVRDPFGTLVTANGDFFNIEDAYGTDGDDVLLGDDTQNELAGGDGDNIIYGYGGNDHLWAGFGNSVFYGGSGHDRIGGGTGDNILFGEAGNDFLAAGSSGDEEMHGGEGCDKYAIGGSDSGTDTIMDFGYPDYESACEKIYITIGSFYRVSFSNLKINYVGDDIIIDIKVKRGGGTGGTIILKDAVLNGVTVDESTFIFGRVDWDCSIYWC